MWYFVVILWIVSLSSRNSPLAHVTPLELHLLPYRWHYPTPIVVAPSVIRCAAPADVDHDAPSGREAELKDKDKYGEDYILEEIEFSHSDIGHTGKLDYYIDEGIDYYDVDIFAASYSGEKTPPKHNLKFGSTEDHGRQVDDGSVQNNQDGRHFNSYVGRPDVRTTNQNTDSYISVGSRIRDFEGNSGQYNHDGRHFSVQDGTPGYQTTYQNTHRPMHDSRIGGLNGYYGENNQPNGNFYPHRGSPQYQTTEMTLLHSTIQSQNIQDGRHFNQHGGSPDYQTRYQNTGRPINDPRIQGLHIQDGGNFNRYDGSPEQKTQYQATDRTILHKTTQGQNNPYVQQFNQHDGTPDYRTQYQTTDKTLTDSRSQAPNNQDGRHSSPHGGTTEYQTPPLHLEPSIVTSSKGVHGGHFVYKLSRRGQDQGKLRARVDDKDEIMDAVE